MVLIHIDRIVCPPELDLQPGAAGFQLSNPPVLQMMCLLGSLNVFKKTSMAQLTKKSRILTTYLELLLEDIIAKECKNIFASMCVYLTVAMPSTFIVL